MDTERLRKLLEDVAEGRSTIESALGDLRALPFEDLGDLKLDHHRAHRTGIPETVYGEGKTLEHVLQATRRLADSHGSVLATRLSTEFGEALSRELPHGVWHPRARVFHVAAHPVPATQGNVVVLSAGTSDIGVAEEAAVTARAFGAAVETVFDVGVSGLHRVLDQRAILHDAHVVVVVAGMEGALPSVVAGLVDSVIIAVPTSVGYGASFHGLAALLGMLNSCGSGVLVCNIDNGYGAGVAAARIGRLADRGGDAT